MDIKEYFSAKKEITKYCKDIESHCSECPFSIFNNSKYVDCKVLEYDYPDEVEKIIQKYIDSKNSKYYCGIDSKQADITRCNKFESCKECRKS